MYKFTINIIFTIKPLIKKKMKNKLSYVFSLIIVVALFTACDSYPSAVVLVGHQNLIVYKSERITNPKNGDYKYAVTDASGYGWTLYSFDKYSIVDTLYISNKKR